MPIRTALWKVGTAPHQLVESSLSREQMLEEMILAAPGLVSEEWMLIGRQEDTGRGGRIDLLAIAPDASLVLIELKREKTPRDVVAQALDYASWVVGLRPEDIAAIYSRFAPGHSLESDFQQRFGEKLDEEELNQSHQIVIVASSLDESSERIVAYLSGRNVPINVLCFQVFSLGDEQLLSRAWLLDPVTTQISTASKVHGESEPWNGEFYCSFGEGESRSWSEAVQYGFISGGGGPWYSRTLKLLHPDNRVWVKVPDTGFVGVGRVTGVMQAVAEFKVRNQEGRMVPFLGVATKGTYHREFARDKDRCEYIVPVKWLQTVPVEQAIWEVGLFGNQNTVCQPTTPKWRFTVERLKTLLPKYNSDQKLSTEPAVLQDVDAELAGSLVGQE